MRVKEDHMKNGQLKPCYNVQFSTSDKFVVNYTTGQTSSDTILYQAHMKNYNNMYYSYPESDTADSGYGSEENYEYLKDNHIEGYVKFSYFHKEQKKSFKEDPSKKENLYYNKEKDCYYCPMGQPMEKIAERHDETETGFKQTHSIYQAKNCEGCPMRGVCHQSKTNRVISVNHNLEKHKAKARELLTSEKGIEKRGQRCVDVEGTFGQLKANKGFRRFLLRGSKKINIELGLLALGMNLARMAKKQSQLVDEVCPLTSKISPNLEEQAHLAHKTV